MKRLVLYLATIFLSHSIYAQKLMPNQKSRLDSLFTILESHDKGMGAVSIFRDGKEIYRRYYGYASLEDKLKANVNTKYRIGSMSKMFTATIILKLMEKKKLSLQTKLSEFYPQINQAQNISIENLLKHRSGIANFTDLPDYSSWNEGIKSESDLLQKIYALPSNFAPDEKFEYSNTNYLLLSLIAQKITGKKYADLLNKYIIQPCKLLQTLVSDKINPAHGEALSYTKFIDWQLATETKPLITLGAGAITSTPYDVNLFFKNLFTGTLLSKESLQLIQSFQDGHSLGFQEFSYKDLRGIGHGGKVDGFQAYSSFFADKNTSIVFTSNAILYPMYDIWIHILDILFEYPSQLPVFYQLEDKDLEKYTGVYANPQFPFKFTLSAMRGTLVVEGDGQRFALEYIKDHRFKLDLIGLVLDFNPDKCTMLFKQSGGEFEFKKETK